MSSFISALIKQRKDAKKAEPDTHGRLKEIISILNKYDYKDGITPEIVVCILQDLGPTFVKIGQIASQQAEYIPPDYCDALAKLRSNAAPMDIETVHAQIEKYLGKKTDELFASFSEKALGSASLAQVHRAELFDGTVVAVKVRRPDVVDTVARDFALIEKVLDKFIKDDADHLGIKGMISELEHTSMVELDFRNEANNLERFRENNKGYERIESPRCYRELSCEAILTEDFASGTEVSDTDFLRTIGEDERDRIAALLADNFATQVLVDGYYHADPHSGNVFIKAPAPGMAKAEPAAAAAENGGDDSAEDKLPLPEHSIQWIDFGMMGSLNAKQRQLLIDIVTEVVMQNAYGLKKTVLQVAKPRGEINHGSLLEICEQMCGQYNGADFGDFDLGDLLGTVIGSLQDESFKVDPFLTNLARGIIAMEGTIKTLSPRVNILNYFTSKVNLDPGFHLNLENPEEMNPEIAVKLVQLFQGLTDSATKSAEALDMLEKGQVKIRTDFSFEEKALNTVNRITGYAIRAFMIAALFLGSCLVCLASAMTGEGDPVRIVFQAMGWIGYAVSVFFAYRLYKNSKKNK